MIPADGTHLARIFKKQTNSYIDGIQFWTQRSYRHSAAYTVNSVYQLIRSNEYDMNFIMITRNIPTVGLDWW